MRFCVLGSGSKGNATYVEAGGVAILIDAGFSGVEIERRLASLGLAVESLAAILVSHEHSDHIRGVQALARRHKLAVLVSRATKEAAGPLLAKVDDWQEIFAGRDFEFNGLRIHPFSVSHDVVDPLGFVIAHGGRSLGYCTDTGITSRLMRHRLSGCHGLILECNHDLEMLKNGGYPPQLQQRIRSKEGHLTNSDAAKFLLELIHDGLEHVVLAHISETNNTHALALVTVQEHLRQHSCASGEPCRFALSVAHQERVGEMVSLVGLPCDD
ncbi:MAG: MBL fold metallo-hydrolase [Desulfobulbaceae bacterium]|nr:MBL fold metallo-hydrolase [Desulfobulbaceae bacterium]